MGAAMLKDYDALLVLSFGGPEKHADVIPFLENVLRGRNIPRERMLEVAEHYYHFGGKSPINEQNRALIAALEGLLDREGPHLPVYWGNRNWEPYLSDTLRQMRADGIRCAAGFVTSAYGSYSGCRQYREDIARAQAEVGQGTPEIRKLPSFHAHPGFIAANTDHLRSVLTEFSAPPHVAFTAHSIPSTMAATSPYVAQLNETARIIVDQLNLTDWALVYQSRSGPPGQPWLEPDIGDHIRTLHSSGRKELVIAPIGFVSDHMEVLYDLDTEAAALCQELGMRMARAKTAGTHPAFVSAIRDLLLGPAQICAADCCSPPQRPTASVRPAPAIVLPGN
jgi:ferrochelatase